MAWQRIRKAETAWKQWMELVRKDGSGNDNRREMEEEREIWRPEVIGLVKHQIDIKRPRIRDSFR